jgi:hypothetical protein
MRKAILLLAVIFSIQLCGAVVVELGPEQLDQLKSGEWFLEM